METVTAEIFMVELNARMSRMYFIVVDGEQKGQVEQSALDGLNPISKIAKKCRELGIGEFNYGGERYCS